VNVRELAQLVSLWSLASLDTGSKTLTFSEDDGKELTVSFEGLHCAAESVAPGTKIGLTEPVAVAGDKLTSALAIFDQEEEAKLTLSRGQLVLAVAKSTMAFNIQKSRRYQAKSITPTCSAGCTRDGIRPLIAFLDQVAAKRMHSPVLTGVNISVVKGKLVLQATDGIGRAAIVPYVPTTISKNEDKPHVTAPVADLLTAISLMDPEFSIQFNSSHIVLHDTRTRVVLSALSGQYPGLGTLPRTFKYTVKVPASAIAAAERAAAILDANRVVRFRVREGTSGFIVADKEVGTFVTTMDTQAVPDIELNFDAEFLGVAKQLASELTIHYTDPRSIVLIDAPDTPYKYWMPLTYRAV
jgi:hypothetical protein